MTRRPRSLLLLLALALPLGAIVVACYPSRMRPNVVAVASAPQSIGEVPAEGWNTESYQRRYDNPFLAARDNPVSTFAVDVDTASYANVRRFIEDGRLPPQDAVRLEELINYFRYQQPEPAGEHPVGLLAEVGPCPWRPERRLVRIGLKARTLSAEAVPPRNLTFLIDVSGSMGEPRKLPLVRRSLGLLVEQLGKRDRIALVVYAGNSGMVLPPTSGADKPRIREAIERLEAGGSTNGGAGIELAYRLTAESFVAGGINRVVLATDGDFNVGVASEGELVRLIEDKRRSGVFLTVLGFGMGNLKDSTLESLADKGNGSYAYIDSLAEARKVLVEEVGGTLVTVAKDVKVQVEVNPAEVASYRLLGYENRLLRREEFDDDGADAGDMGSGQTVTALYEIVPARGGRTAEAGALRYQGTAVLSATAASGELLAVKVRYKTRDGHDSRMFATEVRDDGRALAATSADFRFAAAVASFGMWLRGSADRGGSTPALARTLAADALQTSAGGEYRRGFVALVDSAARLGENSRSARP